MEATCHLDGIRKSFRIDRIQKIFEKLENDSTGKEKIRPALA
jgi:predicted DNA-binding transcriptional regulator YafY